MQEPTSPPSAARAQRTQALEEIPSPHGGRMVRLDGQLHQHVRAELHDAGMTVECAP